MAQAIQKYRTNDGKEFDTEAAANAHEAGIANGVAVRAFVNTHFPVKEGSTRGNPHAGTAVKAILTWIGSGNQPVTIEA